MKVLKKANQKNAMVDTEMYSERELKNMEALGFIFRIDENDVYRVGLSTGDELTVIYNDDYGFYNTVVKKKSLGIPIFVKL